MKMRRVYLVPAVLVIFTVFNTSNGSCCVHSGQQTPSKIKVDLSDPDKRGSILLSKLNNTVSHTKEDAPEKFTINVKEIQKNERKREVMNLDHRIKFIFDPKEDTRIRMDKRDAQQEVISDPRRTSGQKNYICFCKDAQCKNKQCIRQSSNLPKQYTSDDSARDTSAEEVDGYLQSLAPISSRTHPTKFNIPFAKNIKFDQRVIIKNQHPNYPSLPFYQNPLLRAHSREQFSGPNNPTSEFPPGFTYTTPMPHRESYVTPAKMPELKNEAASTFESGVECMKLFGRTVCAISASPKLSPKYPVQTIDLSNDISIKNYVNKNEGNQNNEFYVGTTPYPSDLQYNGQSTMSASPALQNFRDGDNNFYSNANINKGVENKRVFTTTTESLGNLRYNDQSDILRSSSALYDQSNEGVYTKSDRNPLVENDRFYKTATTNPLNVIYDGRVQVVQNYQANNPKVYLNTDENEKMENNRLYMATTINPLNSRYKQENKIFPTTLNTQNYLNSDKNDKIDSSDENSYFKSDIEGVKNNRFSMTNVMHSLNSKYNDQNNILRKPPVLRDYQQSEERLVTKLDHHCSNENNGFYTTTLNPTKYKYKSESPVPQDYESGVEKIYLRVPYVNIKSNEFENYNKYYNDKPTNTPTTIRPNYSIDDKVPYFESVSNVNVKPQLNYESSLINSHQSSHEDSIENKKFIHQSQNFKPNEPEHSTKAATNFHNHNYIEKSTTNNENDKPNEKNTPLMESNESYLGASDTFIPIYAVKGMQNEYGENSADKLIFEYSNNYQNIPQITTPPITNGISKLLAGESKEIFNHREEENARQAVLQNYFANINAHQYQNMRNSISPNNYLPYYPQQNPEQTMPLTTPIYNNVNDYTTKINHPGYTSSLDNDSKEVRKPYYTSNYSSKEKIKSEKYEHSSENEKSVYSYKPQEDTPQTADKSINNKYVTLKSNPLQMQQIKLKESHLATNNSYDYSATESYETVGSEVRPRDLKTFDDLSIYQSTPTANVQSAGSVEESNRSTIPNSQQVEFEPYSTESSTLPIDISQELSNSKTYDIFARTTPFPSHLWEEKVGTEEPVIYYNKAEQGKLSYPVEDNKHYLNYNLRGIVSNENLEESGNDKLPQYIYSKDALQNMNQIAETATPSYDLGNPELNNNPGGQEVQRYKNQAKTLKPTLGYAFDTFNIPTKSPLYNSYSSDPNYCSIENLQAEGVTSSSDQMHLDDEPNRFNLLQTAVPTSVPITETTLKYANLMQNKQDYSDSEQPNDKNNLNFDINDFSSQRTPQYYEKNNPSTIKYLQNIRRETLQPYNLQKEIVIRAPESYSIENANTNDNNKSLESVTILGSTESDEYASNFNSETTASTKVLKNNNNVPLLSTQKITENLSAEAKNPYNKNVGRSIKGNPLKSVGNVPSLKHKDSEKLFKGIEEIILENPDAGGSLEEYTTGSYESIESSQFRSSEKYRESLRNSEMTKRTYYETGSTQSDIQSVDDRPLLSDDHPTKSQSSYLNNNGYSETSKNSKQDKIDETIIQNAVRKVLNNFVPGKAQDLMANYGTDNAQEIVTASRNNNLLPEILASPILKQLFSVPEIENMITDTASNFLARLTGSQAISNVPYLIRNTLHVIINQIPLPHPTVAPMTVAPVTVAPASVSPVAVEEHRLRDGEWVTERVYLLQKSQLADPAVNPPKEVFDKIQGIIYNARLAKPTVKQPIVQNLIVKAVKHSLDKERGIIDESTIRRAFEILIHSRTQNTPISVTTSRTITPTSKARRPVIVQPTTSISKSNDDDDYHILPAIPVVEHSVRANGQWMESKKNLVGKQGKEPQGFNEDRRKDLENKLNQLKSNQSQSKNSEFNEDRKKLLQLKLDELKTDKQEVRTYYSKESVQENYEKSKVVKEHYDNKVMLANPESQHDSIERKPIKYYSPDDRMLDYLKKHPTTLSPALTTVIDGAEDTSVYHHEATTRAINENTKKTHQSDPIATQSSPPPLNSVAYNKNTSKQQANIKNSEYREETFIGISNPNPTGNPLQSNNPTQIYSESSIESKTDTQRQAHNSMSIDQSYRGSIHKPVSQSSHTDISSSEQNFPHFGTIVPVHDRNVKQLNDLPDDSHLVYIGDEVRLPLTIRRREDGSFALTLSDEVCKQFVNKRCPCCLPEGNNGMIMREKRNGEIIPALEFSDDDLLKSQEFSDENKYADSTEDSSIDRIRRESEESREVTYTSFPRKKQTTPAYDDIKCFEKPTEKCRKPYQDYDYNSYEFDNSKTKFNYQKHNPILSELEKLKKQQYIQNIQKSGPPYKYQRYAEEDSVINSRTNVVKNMLYWMRESANQSKNV